LRGLYRKQKRESLAELARELRKNRLAAVFAPAATIAISATATAAAAAVTTAAIITTATTATAAGTLFAWTGFIDGQRAAINGLAVERLGCRIGSFLGFHAYESEPARAPRELIHNQIHFNDIAVGGKHILKLIFGCVEGKISHKQFGTHDDLTFD
jgi:hypothetical protein